MPCNYQIPLKPIISTENSTLLLPHIQKPPLRRFFVFTHSYKWQRHFIVLFLLMPAFEKISSIAVQQNNSYIEIKIMPESKTRHPHKHPEHHNKNSNTHPKPKKASRVVIVVVLFFAFLGLGISYFIDGTSIAGLLAGAVVGGIAGFVFGYQIDKSLSKK